VDEVFVTSASKPELVSAIVAEATRQQVAVTLVPELYGGVACCASLEYLGDLPVLCVYQQPTLLVPRLIKRAMDVVLASAALIVSAPVFAMVAAAIKLDSPGPVFYRHKRVGTKGRRFTLYKFRTMCAGADEKKPMLAPLNQRVGLLFKIAHDPRVTRVGRYLRKYSVDELPQLWNVLKGDMSLVGPRPPSVDEVEYYQIEHLIRLTVPPGITGLWQVSARQDPSFERAVALDAEYIRSWSPWLDLKLLVRTIPAVLKGTGC
jgi:exopolysaccharide biosynthesis polyprenyl glycosylphosphotransferase